MQSGASRSVRRLGLPDDGIVAAFDALAQHARERILIYSAHWRFTVGDIDDWSRAAADRLWAADLTTGHVVGLAAPRGPAFLAGFLGLRRAGCTALLLDDGAAHDDRGRALAAIGTHAILHCHTDAQARTCDARVESAGRRTGGPDPRHPDHAVIKMTSGSAGEPRGVAITTEALLADEDALNRTIGLRPTDRVVASLPMAHRYGFAMLTLPALVRGLPLVMPAEEGPLAPIAIADLCEATVFPTVPAYLQAVLRMTQPPPWPASIRIFMTAGAPLPPTTAAQFRESSGRPVHVLYGASECGGICYDRGGDAGERGTVGTPVEGVSVSLSTTDDSRGAGLLTVRSAGVGETYLPTPDPRLGQGRFQSADLAVWRGGEIALLRRADRLINVRGFKVDPAEVEHILLDLPGVDDVVVVGAPGPGGVGLMIRAIVACRPGALDAAAITAWCRPRLADHKVPRSVLVVQELPRTSRGKIDRAALDHG